MTIPDTAPAAVAMPVRAPSVSSSANGGDEGKRSMRRVLSATLAT